MPHHKKNNNKPKPTSPQKEIKEEIKEKVKEVTEEVKKEIKKEITKFIPFNLINVREKISILTVSRGNRVPFLDVLLKCINHQTYKNIMEWVLVDGSQTQTESDVLSSSIPKFTTILSNINENIKLHFIPFDGTPLPIGALRNKANQHVNGDIIICMDDDDYYLPTYFEHVIDKLISVTNNKIMLAGSPVMNIYDVQLKQIFYYDCTFGLGHTTNNIMNYRREYLRNHKYDNSKTFAEENDFLNNFTEPMVQLDISKCMLQLSHSTNTYSKRLSLLQSYICNETNVHLTHKTLNDFILEPEVIEFYKTLGEIKNYSPYDIVYYTGFHSIKWNPLDKSLGGAEHAIVNLSENWVKSGLKVAVYGNFDEKTSPITNNGVEYFNFKSFNFNLKYKNLILWRLYGLMPYILFDKEVLYYDNLLVDLHENDKNIYRLCQQYINKINWLMVKSEYQKSELIKDTTSNTNGKLTCGIPENKICIIENGTRIDIFENNKYNVKRDNLRCCYTSCYDRGLVNLLKNIWTHVIRLEPRAELHICYGVKPGTPDFQELKKLLATTPNVIDNDRQSLDFVCREKYLCNLQLYLSFTNEIDCISIKESIITGCIPIISNFGVFKVRQGVHFEGDINDPKNGFIIANIIVDLMHSEEKCAEIRKSFNKSLIPTWEAMSAEWIKSVIKK